MRNIIYIIAALLWIGTADAQNEWLFDYRTILPPEPTIPHETARAVSTRRVYPPGGTCELDKVYGVGMSRDATLRELGYTEQAALDSFPTFAEYWKAHGWPTVELLDLYELECAWNDWLWHTDTYLAIGPYIRPNFVCQSRGWIKPPDGWFQQHYPCETALGRYSGKHAQVYSDRSGANPGCTPGTALEIDHSGWSPRAPVRANLMATAWGKDYGVIGGLAYTEGIIIENLRFVGNASQAPAGVFTTGVTLNEPGENSVIRECMSTNHTGAGYTIFNGTPTVIETCSAFNNEGPGFDLLGSNGLCNIRINTPSGDNNKGGLIRIKPKDAQSVGGGTITVTNCKSEARNMVQIPIVIEGKMGDLNLVIDGMTANCEGATLPYLIGGNWTGEQFEVSARGIDLRSNTQALFKHGGKGWTLTGGKPYSGNSFTVNDEGLAFKSRANMTLTGGPTTPPPDPGPVTPPPTGGNLDRTGWTVSVPGTDGANAGSRMLDGSGSTFWMDNTSMKVGRTITVDMKASKTVKGVTFAPLPGYNGSYPRSFEVLTSTDGTNFTSRGTFTGSFNASATFTAVTARYMRVVCRSAATDWWNIAELQIVGQ